MIKVETNQPLEAVPPSGDQSALERIPFSSLSGDSFIEALKKLFEQYKAVGAAISQPATQRPLPPGATQSFTVNANPQPAQRTIQIDYSKNQKVEYIIEPDAATLKTSDNTAASPEQVYLFMLAARQTQKAMVENGLNIVDGTMKEKALALIAARDLGLYVANEAALRVEIPNAYLKEAEEAIAALKTQKPEIVQTAEATFGDVQKPTVGKLRTALNQTAGDILIDAGILTPAQSDKVGRVQAELIAIRDRIDTPAFKLADGKWDEAKVGAMGLKLGGKFNEPDLFPIMKDNSRRANIITALHIGGAEIGGALELVNRKQGINAPKKLGVPPILKIIGAQYPGIVTNEFEDAVPTAHAAIRGLETILRLSNDMPDENKQKQAQGTVQASLKFDTNPDGTAKPGKEDVVTAANAAKIVTDLEQRRLNGEDVKSYLAEAIKSAGPALLSSLQKAQELYKTVGPLGDYASQLVIHYQKEIPALKAPTPGAAPGSTPAP